MEGYDFEVVGDKVPEYVCPVCLQLLRDTIILPCSHSACQACLLKWQKEEDPGENKCPSCQLIYQREKVTEGKQGSFIDRIVTSSLKVKCKQHLQTCDWTGTISDYQIHEKCCNFIEVTCHFPGCEVVMMRKDLSEHQKNCAFRFIECKFCREKIAFKQSEVEHHIQHNCQHAQIHCPFHSAGCTVKILRKDLGTHLSRAVQYHVTILLTHSNNLTDTVESLKRTNEELKTKLQVLEEACLSRLQELELKLCQKEEEKFVNVQARIKELEDEYNQRTDINLNTITEKLNRLEEKIVESEKKSNNSLSLVKSHERTEDSQNEEKLKAAMRLSPEDCSKEWSIYDLHSCIKDHDNERFVGIVTLRPELALLCNNYGISLVHYAARFNNPACIGVLLKNGCEINRENNWGDKPVHSAASYGSVDAARLLISMDSTLVNSLNTKNRKTPLHVAAESSRTAFVKYLLSLPGIDVNIRDSNNKTADECAKNKEIKQIIKKTK